MAGSLITMTAITGKPSRDEIFSYLKSMRDNAIGGIMLYPRSGCELEYLSEEWFFAVEGFLEAAKELGMDIWLYDDFNWPSGDAGGRITVQEKHRLASITVEGENAGRISYATVNNGSLFGEKYFANLLSDEATDRFIELTHDQYYKRFKKYFGGTVKGIFTDEPSIAYSCPVGAIPYYEGVEEDYYGRFGRDFYEDMRSDKDNFISLAMKLLSERFRSCYLHKISDWCHERGILSTGHLMNDHSPVGGTMANGDYLAALSELDLPGVDEIWTRLCGRSIMNLLCGIEYAAAKRGRAMAEIFALGPCDMSYAKRRAMIALLSAFKVNRYFLAISYLDVRGNAIISDYFNSFTADQPDFFGMKLFSEYAARMSSLASRDYKADVYIRYPTLSGAQAHVYSRAGIEDKYFNFINKLSEFGVQYKFVLDEEICDAPLVEFDGEFNALIKGRTVDADELITALSPSQAVADLDGNHVDGFFVRRYEDGELLIINLGACEGDYLICGKKTHVYEFDVIEFNATTCNDACAEKVASLFEVSYHNSNVQRILFVPPQANAIIECHENIEASIAVRDGEHIELDGDIISACAGADFLPRGMQGLYSSATVSLQGSEHSISAGNDLKYLPSVFVCGDFCMDHKSGDVSRLIINERKKEAHIGDKIFDFGTVSFKAEIDIPSNAQALRLTASPLVTTLLINGEEIGTKICPPYEFDIKQYCKKRVCVEIRQTSSIGPIFGDVSYYDEHAENIKWRGTPSPSRIPFGIFKMEFLIP